MTTICKHGGRGANFEFYSLQLNLPNYKSKTFSIQFSRTLGMFQKLSCCVSKIILLKIVLPTQHLYNLPSLFLSRYSRSTTEKFSASVHFMFVNVGRGGLWSNLFTNSMDLLEIRVVPPKKNLFAGHLPSLKLHVGCNRCRSMPLVKNGYL